MNLRWRLRNWDRVAYGAVGVLLIAVTVVVVVGTIAANLPWS